MMLWFRREHQQDRIERVLGNLVKGYAKMAVDMTHLVDSEHQMIAKTDALLSMVSASAAQIKKLSEDLAAALAAHEDTSAIQAQIDAVAAEMDAEVAKASAVTDPAPAVAPVVAPTPVVEPAPVEATVATPVDAAPADSTAPANPPAS